MIGTSRLEYNFEYNFTDANYSDYYALRSGGWPTPSGLTLENVTQHCKTLLTSSLIYTACQQVVESFSVNGIINKCVQDVQVCNSSKT